MVRFSRVWRALLRMGHPQVRWLVWLMTQDGRMPSQFQGDGGGVGALPLNRSCRRGLHPPPYENSLERHLRRNRVECAFFWNAGLSMAAEGTQPSTRVA